MKLLDNRFIRLAEGETLDIFVGVDTADDSCLYFQVMTPDGEHQRYLDAQELHHVANFLAHCADDQETVATPESLVVKPQVSVVLEVEPTHASYPFVVRDVYLTEAEARKAVSILKHNRDVANEDDGEGFDELGNPRITWLVETFEVTDNSPQGERS